MCIAGEDCFRHVLLIPCPGHFMWPLAVSGLGLRYLVIRFAVMLGQPLKKPFASPSAIMISWDFQVIDWQI